MNIRLSYLLYYLYLLQLLPFYLLRKALSLNFSEFESLRLHRQYQRFAIIYI